MKNAAQWLDAANRQGISDYRIAKDTHTSKQTISRMRHGGCNITIVVAEYIGEHLGVEPLVVYAESMATRAKRTDEKQAWVRRVKGLAAGFLIGVIGLGGPVGTLRTASAFTADIHYAQYRRGPRRPTRRFSWIFAQGGGGPAAMAA